MQFSVDGLRVVKAESFMEGDIEAARAEGAQLLWVHSNHGVGPADLDSWGDAEETIEAHEDLGFDVVERVQGWELQL